jgi:hypothetical protein
VPSRQISRIDESARGPAGDAHDQQLVLLVGSSQSHAIQHCGRPCRAPKGSLNPADLCQTLKWTVAKNRTHSILGHSHVRKIFLCMVLGAQQVHERIGSFWRDVLVVMQVESNGVKRGLLGVMVTTFAV